MMLLLTRLVLAANWADGGLSLDELNDVVAFHSAELNTCLSGGPTGDVVLQFRVNRAGTAALNTVMRDGTPSRAACVSKAISSWTFPSRPSATHLQLVHGPRPLAPAPLEDGLADVEGLAAQRVATLGRCVSEALTTSDQTGAISIAVVVGPTGAIVDAQPLPLPVRLAGTGIDRCMVDRLRGWRASRGKTFRRGTLEWFVDTHTLEFRSRTSGDKTTMVRPSPLTSEMDRAFVRQSRQLLECGLVDAGTSLGASLELDGDAGVRDAGVSDSSSWGSCIAQHLLQFRVPPRVVGVVELEFDFTADDEVLVWPAPQGLPKDVILKVIRSYEEEVHSCYQAYIPDHPTLSGKLTIAWTIGPTGRVLEAHIVVNSLVGGHVAECVYGRLMRWQFPAPEGGGIVNVTFPWVFKLAEE